VKRKTCFPDFPAQLHRRIIHLHHSRTWFCIFLIRALKGWSCQELPAQKSCKMSLH